MISEEIRTKLEAFCVGQVRSPAYKYSIQEDYLLLWNENEDRQGCYSPKFLKTILEILGDDVFLLHTPDYIVFAKGSIGIYSKYVYRSIVNGTTVLQERNKDNTLNYPLSFWDKIKQLVYV